MRGLTPSQRGAIACGNGPFADQIVCPRCNGFGHVTSPRVEAAELAPSRDRIAQSLADMIIEWVDSGANMRTDWRPGLANVIALRLERLSK